MAEDTSKNKKGFFKGMKSELKKVTWLTPKQIVNNTSAVLAMVIIVTAIVFVLDFAFNKLNIHVVEGIKAAVQTEEIEDVTNNENEDAIVLDSENENEPVVSENSENVEE